MRPRQRFTALLIACGLRELYGAPALVERDSLKTEIWDWKSNCTNTTHSELRNIMAQRVQQQSQDSSDPLQPIAQSIKNSTAEWSSLPWTKKQYTCCCTQCTAKGHAEAERSNLHLELHNNSQAADKLVNQEYSSSCISVYVLYFHPWYTSILNFPKKTSH